MAVSMARDMENSEEGLFEGCGREGPILAIFLAEFHHIAGPKIVFQYPSETISKEIFDAVSSYIIPKTHLQRITMTVNVLGKKIIGYPIQLKADKYERNAFYFNTCFVCDAWARTVQYESVLVKLAKFFCSLELETEYLWNMSKSSGTEELEAELGNMFRNILQGLNGPSRDSFYIFRKRLLALKVVPAVLSDPPWVESHDVPLFLTDTGAIEKWDLTTQQIIPYVDGFNHVAQISHLSDVHINLVKSCVQNLLYYNVVKIVPAFQYGNSYCLTPEFHSLLIRGNDSFRNECLYYVAKNEHTRPNFVDVMKFYGSMSRGVTLKDLCLRFKNVVALPTIRIHPLSTSKYGSSKYSDHSLSSSIQSRSSSNPTSPVKGIPEEPSVAVKRPTIDKNVSVLSVIDERRLVLFGLMHGLIRRVDRFPMYQNPAPEPFGVVRYNFSFGSQATPQSHSDAVSKEHETNETWIKNRKKYTSVFDMFDGSNNFDKICLKHELSQNQLDDIIDRDPDVYIIWK